MINLAMEVRSQYMTQSSNDDNIQSTSHNIDSDTTTALVQHPLKEVHVSSLKRNTSGTTGSNATQKGKEKQETERVGKSPSSQAHLERAENRYNEELDEMEKDMEKIWDEDDRMTNESVENDGSMISNPSDIEGDEGDEQLFSRLEADNISDEATQDFVATTPSEVVQHVVQPNEVVTENSAENLRSERENSQLGNSATPDCAASIERVSEDVEGKGAASILDDYPMALDSVIPDMQAQVGSGTFGVGGEGMHAPIEAGVRSSNGVGSEVMGDCPRDRDNLACEVARDKEWVMLASGVMRKNGKEVIWEEISDIWRMLERKWEGIEVRPKSTTSATLTLGNRLTKKEDWT